MKIFSVRPATAAWLVAGTVALGLCGAGCHSSPPPPLPVGVTRVDSSKPPPDMQALQQRSQAAKSGASQTGATQPATGSTSR